MLIGWSSRFSVLEPTDQSNVREPVLNGTYGVPTPDSTKSKITNGQVETDVSLFPIVINPPSTKLEVLTGLTDSQGEPITVACATCHTGRNPNLDNRVAADLKEFHTGMEVIHGGISCLSCHNPENYGTFRLADGTRVEHANVMQLCAQCHGTQMRDYEHGVHGGMTGYWDRTKGPQYKLNCVDCHLAHQPKFPMMQPDFKPRDRFLKPSHHSKAEQEH